MNFMDVLKLEKRNLESTTQKCGMLLKHLPKGRLNMQIKNNKPYYREIKADGTDVSVPRNDKIVEQLTCRRLAEQVIKNAAFNHKLLEKILKGYRTYDPNELVRMVSPAYHEMGLHPSYEETLILPDGFVFHPDFSLWSQLDHRKKRHEHVGNVGKPEVLDLTMKKFEELVTFGYYPFRDFIFTFEDPDGNINLQEIKILIETFMR